MRGQIIATLQQRFQHCPAHVIKQLTAVDSVAQLFQLGIIAYRCDSLESFEQQLNAFN
jgi:hypothetical protein